MLMSKKRLEEIKKKYFMYENYTGKVIMYHHVLEWLIEQADRGVEYDRYLISLEDNKHYVTGLEKQNKRYQDMLVKIFKIVQNHQIMKISDEDYADAAIFLYKWIYDTGAIDHQKHFSELHGHDEFDSHQISLLLKRHLEETRWF